jgi:arsenate reductase
MTKTPTTGSVKSRIWDLIKEDTEIDEARKELLEQIAKGMLILFTERNEANVLFVCTHNSRRSQLAEIWLNVAASFYHLDQVDSFSGGTESTDFNIRMVKALNRFGFDITEYESGPNPKYSMVISADTSPKASFFSKKYNHLSNPQEHFIAVMVCDQADQDCPFIPGAFARYSLPYRDPKAYDDTENEAKAYDDKVMEIGREMLYLMKYLKAILSDSLNQH